jgi:hypothetical protein
MKQKTTVHLLKLQPHASLPLRSKSSKFSPISYFFVDTSSLLDGQVLTILSTDADGDSAFQPLTRGTHYEKIAHQLNINHASSLDTGVIQLRVQEVYRIQRAKVAARYEAPNDPVQEAIPYVGCDDPLAEIFVAENPAVELAEIKERYMQLTKSYEETLQAHKKYVQETEQKYGTVNVKLTNKEIEAMPLVEILSRMKTTGNIDTLKRLAHAALTLTGKAQGNEQHNTFNYPHDAVFSTPGVAVGIEPAAAPPEPNPGPAPSRTW